MQQMNDGLRNKINDMMWDLTFQLTKLGYALQQHEKNSEENSEEKVGLLFRKNCLF